MLRRRPGMARLAGCVVAPKPTDAPHSLDDRAKEAQVVPGIGRRRGSEDFESADLSEVFNIRMEPDFWNVLRLK